MNLGALIQALKAHDPATVVPIGFARPCSYRGSYEDVAFEVERNTTVGAMLEAARSALGATFENYNGGEHTMNEHTYCWLVESSGNVGETISPVLLECIVPLKEDIYG